MKQLLPEPSWSMTSAQIPEWYLVDTGWLEERNTQWELYHIQLPPTFKASCFLWGTGTLYWVQDLRLLPRKQLISTRRKFEAWGSPQAESRSIKFYKQEKSLVKWWETCYDPTDRVLGKERFPTPTLPTGGGNNERTLLTRNIYSAQGRKIALKSIHEIIVTKSKAINITAWMVQKNIESQVHQKTHCL